MIYIFDWDGTLSDSVGRIVESVNVAAARVGLPQRTREEIRDIVGLGLREAIAALYPHIDQQYIEALRAAYAEHYLETDSVAPSPFFPGAREVVEGLVNAGHYVAVATGKSRRGLDRVMQQHGVSGLFHATRCADESGSKPHPRMLLEILEELDGDIGEAMMIGDTEFDMEMAHAIGMPRVAVSYGAHHPDRLRRWSPLACLDSLMQLGEISLPAEQSGRREQVADGDQG